MNEGYLQVFTESHHHIFDHICTNYLQMRGKLTFIRAMEQSDIELVRNWNSNAEINEGFVPSFPISMSQQNQWYERNQNDPKKVKLMIVDIATDQPIGLISAMKIDHVNKNCEVGWTIGESKFWGKGHTQDAAIVFCKFLFEQMGMHMIYGYVLGHNIRALKSDEKIGFIETGSLKEFVFKNGEYLDLKIVCLMKENFYSAIRNFGFE